MPTAKQFIADNAQGIIGVIFMLGTTASTITYHEIRLNEHAEAIAELEESKVSYSVLDLKQKTLNGRLLAIEADLGTLDKRVRRKLDGDLQEVKHLAHEIEVELASKEERLAQGEDERKGLWKFVNEIIKKVRL